MSAMEEERVKQMAAEKALRKKISGALTKLHKTGDASEYRIVIKAFEVSPHSTKILWFRSFSGCISLVSQACSELVEAILRYDFNGEEVLNDAYGELLANLVSSNRCFLSPTLESLVALIVPANCASLPPEHKQYVDMRVHRAIRRLAGLAPSAPTALFTVLVATFPHKTASALLHDTYVANLFQFARSFPMLQDRILAVIIERMIHIDVEIVVDSNQSESEEEDSDDDMLFDLEENAGEVAKKSNQPPQGEMANKLDIMMHHCFLFIEQACRTKADVTHLFHVLLEIFDHAILHTHKSKFVQYLMFYVCNKADIFVQQFMSYLLNRALLTDSSPLTKELCIAYAGSFVARSNYISITIVQNCLLALSRWAGEYIVQFGNAVPDPKEHRLFYVLCQTLFYILCFSLGRLLDASTKDEVVANFGLMRLVQCRLNPLRTCNQVIVHEFVATLAENRVYDLHHACAAVLSAPVGVANTNSTWDASEGIRLFFPFEPYVLRNSYCFVKDLYIDWVKQGDNQDTSEDISSYGSDSRIASASLDVESCARDSSQGSFVSSLEDMMSFTPDVHYGVEYLIRSPSAATMPQFR